MLLFGGREEKDQDGDGLDRRWLERITCVSASGTAEGESQLLSSAFEMLFTVNRLKSSRAVQIDRQGGLYCCDARGCGLCRDGHFLFVLVMSARSLGSH